MFETDLSCVVKAESSGASLNPAETFLSLWLSKAHLSVGHTVATAEYLLPQTPALASHSATTQSAPDPPPLLLLLFLNATAFLRQLIPPRLSSLPFLLPVTHVRLTLTLVCPGCLTDSSALLGICDHNYLKTKSSRHQLRAALFS